MPKALYPVIAGSILLSSLLPAAALERHKTGDEAYRKRSTDIFERVATRGRRSAQSICSGCGVTYRPYARPDTTVPRRP